MAGIKEAFEDVKDTLGDKGSLIAVGGIGILALLLFLSNSKADSGTSEVVVASGYASYPDAVTNANTIISTLQNNIDYSESNILDAVRESETNTQTDIFNARDELESLIDSNFSDTNDYIREGFESQESLFNAGFESNNEILGGIVDTVGTINEKVDTVSGKVDTVSGKVDTVSGKVDTVSGKVDTVSGKVGSLSGDLNAINSTFNSSINDTNKAISALKNELVNTKNEIKTQSNSINLALKKYATPSGGWDSKSVVDTFKQAGVDSSLSNRKKLAEAIGINNYRGTAAQNRQLQAEVKKTGILETAVRNNGRVILKSRG